ncbi:DUF3054 domain-containing protein [Rathayibacter iranicus]|uniref:DUF3054 domain-containing protein n=2 Tax=Rathayibacter iranicus TaxID=59737 RepID=A0AAD1ACF8_9MICO|nr:DUF3054 domain-containing protein [Rathayibacter iranicus]AZZ54485.1 DUF3054 domain-containing protein [Rathayibacter iranicus]MWV29910.1 DUF3054 family protein [Rathayibacter iranicus NCPPB 2253 = VKM Ac-1602]PPI51660.1 DUF3054 domain-containing protein [Rathayibacter iranicus]PPI63828.1 DUF3054 domain-containing protein [Rathayibacter iranicus]PPI74674.1 DUF3054 domain-containing protein [Rathayibacter iranicus]
MTSRAWLGLGVDTALVLVFVVIGRRSHEEGSELLGLATTLWPFLIALLVGWAVSRSWRAPDRILPTGLVVWAVTVVGGMLLRLASGQGVQWSFVIVTAVVLAVFLLGRRALTRLKERRSRS